MRRATCPARCPWSWQRQLEGKVRRCTFRWRKARDSRAIGKSASRFCRCGGKEGACRMHVRWDEKLYGYVHPPEFARPHGRMRARSHGIPIAPAVFCECRTSSSHSPGRLSLSHSVHYKPFLVHDVTTTIRCHGKLCLSTTAADETSCVQVVSQNEGIPSEDHPREASWLYGPSPTHVWVNFEDLPAVTAWWRVRRGGLRGARPPPEKNWSYHQRQVCSPLYL
ncbi:hypothetical protein PHLGIDRAFT_338789 [Phlebiopsis gigantea 11061_1 CR5-6]|uniref:Uncharacterized protein n=1 Tax=Phlebiopsis gigantea (strain 11061_1 CR5-6) TaxID=745531 RepID=A0A0C3SAJ7_PHLG1|nr:hypothetical protein PHLGIDRAFT_338789 [Phlebiopsis gigantea 11061_1 CR5-6]